ncbi:ribonuclease H-like domain-containing protein [Tanacetum coccineum]
MLIILTPIYSRMKIYVAKALQITDTVCRSFLVVGLLFLQYLFVQYTIVVVDDVSLILKLSFLIISFLTQESCFIIDPLTLLGYVDGFLQSLRLRGLRATEGKILFQSLKPGIEAICSSVPLKLDKMLTSFFLFCGEDLSTQDTHSKNDITSFEREGEDMCGSYRVMWRGYGMSKEGYGARWRKVDIGRLRELVYFSYVLHLMKILGLLYLPSSWNNVALIMRNKDGIDDLDIDDLYNNLKVFEADIKGSSESSSNSQNVAFLFAEDTSSSNEVNTANSVSTTSGHNSQGQASSSSYTDDLMFFFFANQSNSSQLDDEDLEQIDHDDLEEMDLKWQVAMLSMRVKRFYKKTGRNLIFNGKELVGFDKTKDLTQSCLEEKIAVLEFEVKDKGNVVTRLTNQLDQTLKEKEDLKAKLEQFETSSKNLNKLINSQISSKDKTSLGYGDQLNENDSSGSELFNNVFDSHSSDGDDNQTNDRFKKDNEYHAVPPPLTGNYMPPLADLSFTGLNDYVYRPIANKTSASVSQVETNITPPSNTSVEMPRVESVRPSRVIIEDWVSDEDEDIFQSEDSQTPVDRKDWNGKMTQKLGLGFGFTKKSCFVCGSHNHLIKDYDFHEKRMPKESVLGKGTSHREVKPIWNNTQRINYQNKFVPTAVLTRSGRIPISTAKQYVKTATSKNKVNVSKSKINTFPKSYSPVKRLFINQQYLIPVSKVKVNIVKLNGVNTAGQTAVSTVMGNGVTAVKASVACVWRPKKIDLNNGSKDNSGSWISKRENPQQALKYKGMFDSGCSRHVTGNIALLTNYQDINGGFVAFDRVKTVKVGLLPLQHMTEQSLTLLTIRYLWRFGLPLVEVQRCKITGIGKIRTNKIDFEDVFFVKELKFNLFSVSQMCDKKNSILFTKTKFLVLSPDFKLIDEIQVLLRVPRQNNMYNFDLKNVVPSRDLTCLFAKATIDESKPWHRRLGHVNFKTMNKVMKGNLVRGLPSKTFENDHTCVACQKGKQHKASYKTKLAEAVNTAFYVLNRVLVTKPHIKTPYELIIGRAPSISFMRPFGCPVTILNTLDPLGKFDGKAEEGFLVGYSVNSKAFRVFNTETKKVKQNLHVNFLENKPNVVGQGPKWLFDIDSLTNSMNYQPVTVGNQTNKNIGPQETNGNTGLKKNVDVGQTEEENSLDDKAKDYTVDDDACKKTVQEPASEYDQALKNVLDKMMDQEKEATEQSDAVRKEFKAYTPVNTASASRTFSSIGPSSGPSFILFGGSFPIDVANLPHDPLMPEFKDTIEIQSTSIFGNAYDDHDLETLNTPYADQSVGVKADFNNMESSTVFSLIPTTRVHSIHPKA